MSVLLAIDTSCDETAVSIFDLATFLQTKTINSEIIRSEIISSQIQLHQEYGGVVPELAAREHLTNLPLIVSAALKEARCSFEDIGAVAVTRGPGLNGCLLVGLCFAKGLSYSQNVPLIALNHIEGHLYASELMGISSQFKYPAMALIVSGGHTVLISVEGFRNYKIVAQTRDDAAGEAFDKCAAVIGLPYPGGPNLSKRAIGGDSTRYRLPVGMPGDNGSFSFSGLKTAALRLVSNLGGSIADQKIVADVCASIQEAIISALVSKTLSNIDAFKPVHFVLAGGVAANALLRKRFSTELAIRGVDFIVPDLRWCTDNASMVGALALRIIGDQVNSVSGPDFKNSKDIFRFNSTSSVGSLPRWPINKIFSV